MDSTQDNSFIYDRLDATASQVRVLTLHRGSRDEELRCSLKTVSLDDQPRFHALSYVWGSGTEKDRINIHGHVVSVTSNLGSALREIRDHHYEVAKLDSIPLWIDAICINQADIEERVQQVLVMRRIYRQASRVLLWIGEGDELSDYVFDRIDNATFRASCAELKTISRAPTLDEIRVKIIVERNVDSRRYWTRTWTLQEVVLATQDPVMLCGSRRIFWSWYTQCKSDLPHYSLQAVSSMAPEWKSVESEVPLHQDLDDSPLTCSQYHEALRDLYQEYGHIKLGIALWASAHLTATDPRDSVYAVLGLVSHRYLHSVDIDYTKTPERVFKDIMSVLWTSSEDVLIAILPEFNFGPVDEKSNLPSWVSDFSRRLADGCHARGLMYHSKQWRRNMPAEVHIEDNVLTVKAYKFDSVTDTLRMGFYDGSSEYFHRGKAPNEVDIEPLQDAEVMAARGRRIPIPASSRLGPFSVLRNRTPIWSLLTTWHGDDVQNLDVGSGNGGIWLPGIPRDRERLWEILLGRQQIPEAWKMACSPELRNNLPALEAAVLSPILESIGGKIDDKKVFISQSGFIGVATKYVEAGDIVIFIVGMACMYVLRPFRDGYRMVGFANVPDLMNWDDLDEAMRTRSLHEEELKIY